MFKILVIGSLILFFSSGALVYNNGTASLNMNNAKNTLIQTYKKVENFVKNNS